MQIKIISKLYKCNINFQKYIWLLNYSSSNFSYFLQGATVLFLNATDFDRSREYGQESIIYSLEGSSHFRINARSGKYSYDFLLTFQGFFVFLIYFFNLITLFSLI